MDGVLNTSGQSNYHSCRQSLENMIVHEGNGDVAAVCSENDSTFVCSSSATKDNSDALSPSSAEGGDLSVLAQSNVIAESTRTSIMNGSGFGAGSGDDSAYEPPPQTILSQKLTGGIQHAKSSTPCAGDSLINGSSNGNMTGCGNLVELNDCLINSALGCSASINDVDANNSDGLVSTTPLRSKQQQQGAHFFTAVENGNGTNSNNENGVDGEAADDDDDLIIDDVENGPGIRQNRSGSFTVIRDKALPGTPIIEDEPLLTITEDRDRNGSVTPPSRSPGLMQDSASRPLIPKAKNRRSVWTGDVFSPAALSNMKAGASENAVLIPAAATTLTTTTAATTADDYSSSPLLPLNTSGSATFSRSTAKMLLEAVATSCEPSAVALSSDEPANLSFHSNGGSNGNHSYEIGSEENGVPSDNITPVIDAANASAALGLVSSFPCSTAPLDDGVVGNGGNLEFLRVGSSATITKSKPTPGRSPATVLPHHMMSPAIQICPPVPPASSSPKHHNNNHIYTNGSNGNGGLPASPLLENGKVDGHSLCATPILPAEPNITIPLVHVNGCGADDADRSELLARITQLELENSMLKSKMSKFEEINNHLVVSCSQLGNNIPMASDLEEFHKFVHCRLLAAEEVSDDYRSLELSFNDLHRRYERARAIIVEAQNRDRQLQADINSMKQAAGIAEQRIAKLMHDFETQLADVEAKNAALQDTIHSESLKNELKIGQIEIESRNLHQQLQQRDTQIADLNRLLAQAMASTARRV